MKCELNIWELGAQKVFAFLALWLLFNVTSAQEVHHLEWKGVIEDNTFPKAVRYIGLENASYTLPTSILPEYNILEWLPAKNEVKNIGVKSIEWEDLTQEERNLLAESNAEVSDQLEIDFKSFNEDGKKLVRVSFTPLLRRNGTIKKVKSISFQYDVGGGLTRAKRSTWVNNSVLASGNWLKVAVVNTGVYKIDYDFLKSNGIAPEKINLAELKAFGINGGQLPERNDVPQVDDLTQLSIQIVSKSPTRFDVGDYVLFYAEGPHSWIREGNYYRSQQNIYSDTSYVFITWSSLSEAPKRIGQQANLPATNNKINTYNDFQRHEIDRVNLISSGRKWFGESFVSKPKHIFDFNFPDMSSNEDVRIRTVVGIRSVNATSSVTVSAGGIGEEEIVSTGVSGEYSDSYAHVREKSFTGKSGGDNVSVFLSFNKGVGDAQAWLDIVEVNCRRTLSFYGNQFNFRDINSTSYNGNVTYEVSRGKPSLAIWDVTTFHTPKVQEFSYSGGKVTFTQTNQEIKEFVIFDPARIGAPEWIVAVGNQDIHAVQDEYVDYLIVSHPNFLSAANDLAKFHEEKDGMKTKVVTVGQIYNEFSGGRQDLTAIKNFVRCLYEKAPVGQKLKYLLLFGDASFDYKNTISGNTNYVPIYQFENSVSPTESIATDDYVAFIAPGYVGPIESGLVQVGVGRFPVKTIKQANEMVNKVKAYYDQRSFGAWRNRLVYIADDEDRNTHMIQASDLANYVDTLYSQYNVEKILADAYPQRSTPGGHRYPDVNDAVDNALERGALTVNYLGHGGELGWAHERILEVAQINQWSNANNMPLFVTATCEFSRFDDPKRTSAGEFVFLNPSGGGIGLLTTTRLVYSTPNYALSKTFNRVAYKPDNGEMPRLGDVVRLTKREHFNANSRVFALIGDPALRLAYPRELASAVSRPDSIRALDLVTITGEVKNRNTGKVLTDYNGVIYPTVYDKAKTLKTLNNDNISSGKLSFSSRSNVLFRGKASVTNGKYSFSFVVPKDIDFNYGLGKISFYGTNGIIDANGFDTTIIVGGKNPNAKEDKVGPRIDLFLNDSTFVNGGITDEAPVIIANLFDDNGINTSGNGIGHDLVAIIDGNTAEELVLNEYYESNLNSYQSGKIRYPLKKLTPGAHTLKLKAWDVYNNSAEASINFVVAESEDLSISHVLNYPNPFTTNTDFYLEHNQPNQDLFVRIQVFTVSGKVVKTIDGTFNSKGYRLGPINWSGRDDFGDKIGKGVYIYKVFVKSPSGDIANKFEKLVILN